MKNKILYIFVFVLLSVYEIVSVAHVAFHTDITMNGNFIPFFEKPFLSEISIALFFVVTLFYFFNKYSKKNIHGFSKSILVFFVYVYSISVICSIFSPLDTVVTYITILVPLLTFFFFRYITPCVEERIIMISVCVLYVFLAYAYYVTYNTRMIEMLTNKINTVTNTSYFLVYLLPFLLCSKKTLLKGIAIVLTAIICFSSLKRGSTICLGLGLALYFLEISRTKKTGKKNHLKVFIISIIVLIAIYYFFQEFVEISGGELTKRFESMSEDGGTNRMDIYRVTVQMIFNSNPIQLLFGHGWFMVVKDSPLEFSAHNDFLEIFYDVGFIGLVLFILLLVSLLRWYRCLHERKSIYAAPLLASLGIFFFGMLVSHIIITPFYFALFCATWGYIYSIESETKSVVQVNS